ncbi:uncharacterized protein TRIADDRAFT_20762 [Trichoplax adhaerens]|uniref:BTB domain-containing protein n=1 Tax=Trichoplax adhaerens TaxID=10228 RepID=B3RN40_TRIAD|nr:hypothetical protein TRIADDRAFT_20762 [Trichoplax adhaerens]EDV27386.1 hypothetical protein TRIADDRAFT_20762 [Trichoplax adhaerens]|eukprot:XP_002109220.1 hypothetical protein TRIADDRAFT_20762 [Trichoplax adhaerens]
MATKNVQHTVPTYKTLNQDQEALFRSCRTGDISKIQYLFEYCDIEVNLRDAWDATPLYYACLCGHKEIVQILLANGAKCNATTFDGERCLYAALYDEIRNLLRSRRAITSHTMRRDAYHEFLRRYCILNNVFNAYISNVNLKSTTHCLKVNAAGAMRRHRMLILNLGYVDVLLEEASSFSELAKQCGLQELRNRLISESQLAIKFSLSKSHSQVNMITIMEDEGQISVQNHMKILVNRLLPKEFRSDLDELFDNFEPLNSILRPDLIFCVGGYKFYGHKVFFCERSDYFKALLLGNFAESIVSNCSEEIPVINLNDCTPDIFSIVMVFIYAGDVKIPCDLTQEILYAADKYLIPGLKRHCCKVIIQNLQTDNVIQLLETARLLTMPKLELECTRFISKHLLEMVERDDFAKIIIDDATSIIQRQETDSIPIIDEVRYHLGEESLQQSSEKYNEILLKNNALDKLLMNLNIEC